MNNHRSHQALLLLATLTAACATADDSDAPPSSRRARIVFDGAELQRTGAPVATIDVRPSANTDYVFDQSVAAIDFSQLGWIAPGDDAPQPLTEAASSIDLDLEQDAFTIRSGEAPDDEARDDEFRVACGSFGDNQPDLDCEVTCYYWGCDYWCCSGGNGHHPRVQ